MSAPTPPGPRTEGLAGSASPAAATPPAPRWGPTARLRGFLRTYWHRGEPGRPTPRSLTVFMARMWLLALLCKLIGASWDVSWHFKWLRDDLAPPHLINTIGTGIAIGLVLAHTFTGYGADRRSLRIMQLGTGIFVVAGPIDVINHRVNGLDLTAWSPSHLLLYTGTAIMVAGVLRNWVVTFPRDHRREWTAGLVVLFAFLFEDLFFPTGQQEYGILEIESWLRGAPFGEGELLNFAASQIGRPVDDIAIERFAMPIASWVYPVWVLGACVAVLVLARLVTGWRWAATTVVALYLAYRCVIWPLLTFTIFPPSVVPFWLLPVGLAVDLLLAPALLRRLPPALLVVVGALGTTAVGYGALALQSVLSGTPLALGTWDITRMRAAWEAGDELSAVPVDFSSWWIAALCLLATWSAVTWGVSRTLGLTTPRPPAQVLVAAPEPPRDERGHLVGAVPAGVPAPARAAAPTGARRRDRRRPAAQRSPAGR